MPWEPGTLLGLLNPARPLGKFPGASLFVMLENDKSVLGGVIVLTPRGTRAFIPQCFLMPVLEPPPVPPGPTQPGGGG